VFTSATGASTQFTPMARASRAVIRAASNAVSGSKVAPSPICWGSVTTPARTIIRGPNSKSEATSSGGTPAASAQRCSRLVSSAVVAASAVP